MARMTTKVEMIENFLNNIFGSRAKIVDPRFAALWIREISLKNPDIYTLQEAEKIFIADDTIAFTIAQVCRLIDEARLNLIKRHTAEQQKLQERRNIELVEEGRQQGLKIFEKLKQKFPEKQSLTKQKN